MRPLWLAALAALPTTLLVHGLKKAVAAPRPAAVLEPQQIVWFDLLPKSGAFPSGHTATAVILGGALLCGFAVRRKRVAAQQRTLPEARIWLIGAGFVLLVFAIALSRVAVGAHWPSDVIGGLGAGLFGLTVAAFLIRRFPEPSPQTTRFLLVGGLATAAYAPFDHAIYPSGAALVWVVALAAWVGAIRRFGGQ
nr:phosphatase PAP2 family protein [Hydrogenophilus thiooxidans]